MNGDSNDKGYSLINLKKGYTIDRMFSVPRKPSEYTEDFDGELAVSDEDINTLMTIQGIFDGVDVFVQGASGYGNHSLKNLSICWEYEKLGIPYGKEVKMKLTSGSDKSRDVIFVDKNTREVVDKGEFLHYRSLEGVNGDFHEMVSATKNASDYKKPNLNPWAKEQLKGVLNGMSITFTNSKEGDDASVRKVYAKAGVEGKKGLQDTSQNFYLFADFRKEEPQYLAVVRDSKYN
jgi:hypothetical protein